MCKYCEKGKSMCNSNTKDLGIELHSANSKLVAYGLDKQGWDISIECNINYCPMCRKEVGRVKQILDYSLELENVKENELPEKDNEKIIQFNNTLSEKYGLFEIDVLENDNLYFRGRITSNTKSENNAKLKLLIAEINEFYKKYNLKKVIKSMIAYGHTI